MTVGERYRELFDEIVTVAVNCGRDPNEIKLVAVTKGYPLEHVLPAYDAGAKIFGENRVQEALLKIDQAPKEIDWHLIGSLQKNKVRKAVGRFSLIHSVDCVDLARKISEVSIELGIVTAILLQVNTSGEETKHGLTPLEFTEAWPSLLPLKGIDIQGLMTMAPFVEDPQIIRECFQELRLLRDKHGLKHLSMGMSHDWRLAIEEGATLLRVGSAIFRTD